VGNRLSTLLASVLAIAALVVPAPPASAGGLWDCRSTDGEGNPVVTLSSSRIAGQKCRPFDSEISRPTTRCKPKKRYGRTIAEACDRDGITWYIHNEPPAPPPGAGGPAGTGGTGSAVSALPGDPRPAGVAARAAAVEGIIARAAALHGVPESLLRAVIMVESGFRPEVVSAAGAQGLMQLMPVTADSLDVDDPFDPEQNILAGARFIRILSDRFHGDIERVVAAYFSGPTAVSRAGGVPTERCAKYVRNVLTLYRKYTTP
jgi:hypothetical protein